MRRLFKEHLQKEVTDYSFIKLPKMVATDEGMIPTETFLLSEGVSPSFTPYGNNSEMDNNEVSIKHGLLYTFFRNNNETYVVSFSLSPDGIIVSYGGTVKTGSLNVSEYDYRQTMSRSPITIFNKVFYVILEVLAIYNKRKINVLFTGSTRKQESLYDTIIASGPFQRSMHKAGYSYIGKNAKNHLVFQHKAMKEIWDSYNHWGADRSFSEVYKNPLYWE